MKRVFFFSVIFLVVLCLYPPFKANSAEKDDIISGLNTLPLLTNKITGDTTIAIIYDPDNEWSHRDAAHIKTIIDGGMEVPGGGRLSAILVSVNELGKLSRAQIAFLAQGLASHYADISTATSAASILTITTDIACVRAGQCIIGVITRPSVTIYYSKSAAESAKIEFSQAFSMLVKQP